jgi:diguanylate cyclase (GGDEF)-like protein
MMQWPTDPGTHHWATARWLSFTLLAGGSVHTLACWLALQLDFFRGAPSDFYLLFSVIWAGNLLLLALGLCGAMGRLTERQISAIVLCWSTLIVLVSAFFVDQIRLCIMVFFFAIVQAGVFHASRRLLIWLGVFAVAGYGVILLVVHLLYPTMVDWLTEMVQWVAFTVVAVGAMFLAVDISTLRRIVAVRNRQLAAIAARILNMAMHDELTGLYNRRHAMERLGKLRELASRGGLGLHVAYLDLDHFKRINDSHGHGTGDEVLRRFAALLKRHFSDQDFAARIGGEEFLLVLVNRSADDAWRRLEVLRQEWRETRFDNRPDIIMTVSVGLAEFRLRESLTEWLARADAAMYRAKSLGRNRVCVAGSGEPQEALS